MNRSEAPVKQAKPFGVNGQREPLLPTTPAGDNTASYDLGFPPITMILKSAGGLPPKGQDMNQILYELSSLARWTSAGALYTYDSSFSSAVSGYPSGSILIGDNGEAIYVNTVDGNTTNPNIGGAGWKTLLSFAGGVSASGGDYDGYFNFKQVGTLPHDQNQNYLVSPTTTSSGGLASYLQNMWHGHNVQWGIVRDVSTGILGAGISIDGVLKFNLNTDGSITSEGNTFATQSWTQTWANNLFMQKSNNLSDVESIPTARSNLELGSAATRDVGTGSNQIPDMNSFQSGSNGLGTWIKHPSGVIVQFGLYPESGPTGGISFPTPFTEAPSYTLTPTATTGIMAVSSGSSTTGINNVRTFDSSGNIMTNGVSWTAIGR